MVTKIELEKAVKTLEKKIQKRDIKLKELFNEIIELRKTKNDRDVLIAEKTLLLKQQREFKEFAEKAGSETAKWKHDYLRLVEEYNKSKVMK